MKQTTKTIFLILLCLILFSCSSDDSINKSDKFQEQLIGYWELESYRLPDTSFDLQNTDEDYYQFNSDGTFKHKYILKNNNQMVTDWQGYYEVLEDDEKIVLHRTDSQFTIELNILKITNTEFDFYRHSILSGNTIYHYVKR